MKDKATHDDSCENRPGGEYDGKLLGGRPIPCHCPARAQGIARAIAEDKGTLESLDGWWEVHWDNADNTGQYTYRLFDRDEGYWYVARYDDGWRIAPEGHGTVDMERLLPNDSEWDTLRDVLNRARGVDEPGILK